MYKLHIPADLPYARNALPPGGFPEPVEVGFGCSTTRVAQPYSGVPTFSRAGVGILTFFYAKSGIQFPRAARLPNEYRPDLNRAGPWHAKNPRSGLVIGVASRPWGSYQSTVRHALERPDRRQSSLSDLVGTATSAWRPPWVSVLRKSTTARSKLQQLPSPRLSHAGTMEHRNIFLRPQTRPVVQRLTMRCPATWTVKHPPRFLCPGRGWVRLVVHAAFLCSPT